LAAITIGAIEHTEAFLLTKNILDHFKNQSNDELMKHIILLSSTAEERYVNFMKTYQSFVQRLPLKLIASYISFTPEFEYHSQKNSFKIRDN